MSYPIKVRWHNDMRATTYFATREMEPLYGTPEEQRDLSDEELETISECVFGRQKTNIVVRDKEEAELVVERLEAFANGIAHPGHGGSWATTSMHKAVLARAEEIHEKAEGMS